MEAHESIAEAYSDSKHLSFREWIERYTLFEMLGDIRGKKLLDAECGDGLYSRLFKQAGAAEVTGVDGSATMIRLAEQNEQRHPVGCTYLHRDIAAFEPDGAVDIVVALYMLNYAGSAEQLLRFCRTCYNALRPGGRFVGLNDNVQNPPRGTVSWKKYGFEKSCTSNPTEGDVILYAFTNNDGRRFEFKNSFLTPDTYGDAFEEAGFKDFRWLPMELHPDQRNNPFWDDFMTNPPVIAFEASK